MFALIFEYTRKVEPFFFQITGNRNLKRERERENEKFYSNTLDNKQNNTC
jgi:hypothetical protein